MPPLTYRSPTREDLGAVVELLNACDVDETGRPDTDASDVLGDWSESEFDLRRDAWMAVDGRDGEAVVGYAALLDDFVQVAVHPDAHGLGIGSRLRESTEGRAVERLAESGEAEARLWQAPRKTNTAAHLLLESAGYTRAHHYARMEREIRSGFAGPKLADGVTIRAFQPGRDEHAMHDLHNRSWAEYPTAPQLSYERWAELFRDPAFDPELWYIAEEGGEAVGNCRLRLAGDIAYVAMLGVDPGRRGRGLGEALLRHALAQLSARGVHRATLNVSSRNTAVAWRLYARVGFRATGGWIAFEKTLHR